jgi:hypothetical protein
VNTKGSALVLCAFLALAAGAYFGSLSEAANAQTRDDVFRLVSHAKTSVDHQKLVKWYEEREVEVRNQARLYKKLAATYREFYKSQEMTTACDEIARYYDTIAEHYETLAEQHRHMAANSP